MKIGLALYRIWVIMHWNSDSECISSEAARSSGQEDRGRTYAAFFLHMSTKPNAGADAVALAFLDVMLHRRNITIAELAERCGWIRRAFVNQVGAGFPCKPLRWKVEFALGFLPIWSASGEVDLRQRCFNAQGVDPRTATLPDLKDLCRKLGVPSPQTRRQGEWYSNLILWLAVHPKT